MGKGQNNTVNAVFYAETTQESTGNEHEGVLIPRLVRGCATWKWFR